MNITRENVDQLNAVLRVSVEKKDYENQVNNKLKEVKKKAQINGFRPGHVPMGLIKKMAGTQAVVEEVNKLVMDEISKYLVNEKIDILGEPLFNEKEQSQIDWENQDSFQFVFDIGLSPVINLSIDKNYKLPYYKIDVDAKMIDDYVEEYSRRFGKYSTCETIETLEEMLKGDIYQLTEDGRHLENGISAENALIVPSIIKDETIKNSFKGKRTSDKIVFNIKKAYPNNSEIAALLRVSKEVAETIDSEFEFVIKDINKWENSEITQELFDKVFGADNVKSIDEFRAKISEQISKNLENESNYRFFIDTKVELIKKADIKLPVDFLKRWLIFTNNGKFTKEEIDTDFIKFEDELKWQVIKNQLLKVNNIAVTEEDIKSFAKEVALAQFQQYGMANVEDAQLEYFAASMLKKEEDAKRLYERKTEDKLIQFIKAGVTLKEEAISKEKFDKLFEKEENK